MTKESKLALIMSFVLILVVGVLISDHFSHAGSADLGVAEPEIDLPSASLPDRSTPEQTSPTSRSMLDELSRSIESVRAPTLAQPIDTPPLDEPVVIVNAPAQQTQDAQSRTAPWCRVQEGDSLYAIARRELGDGDRWREIQRLNTTKLGGGTTLRAGMTLELPGDAKGERPATKTAPVARREITPPKALRTHVVEQGDALGLIAQKYLGTVRRMDEIVELNGLRDADDIRIGMTLKIPAK